MAKPHGLSVATIYGWRQHFGTLEASDVKYLRRLQENARLNKMVQLKCVTVIDELTWKYLASRC